MQQIHTNVASYPQMLHTQVYLIELDMINININGRQTIKQQYTELYHWYK
jgi:hypothetical protein